jgi:tetratricopeptide (TPR) repeat protein
MFQIVAKVFLLGSFCTLCLCQKQIDDKEKFARVGGTVLSQTDFKNFQMMQREYPTQMGELFPGNRSAATSLVETEALAQKAGWLGARKVESSADWKWKELYFPGQMYIKNVLSVTLGFTENDIKKYYDAHRDDFKMVFKVPVNPADTSKVAGDSAQASQPQMRDSVEYLTLESAKGEIVKKLFFVKYPPSAEFYKAQQPAEGDSNALALDSNMVKERWLATMRADLPQFFMKKFYEEKYGKPYSDSLSEWYGEGKAITPADLEVILNWLPEGRRDGYKNPQGTRFLTQWLLKWKLFAEQAQKNGYASKQEVVDIMRWAKRFDVASSYVKSNLMPAINKSAKVDTLMCVYSYWDRESEPGVMPDTGETSRSVAEGLNLLRTIALDKEISAIRQQKKVTWFQNDWKDDKDKSAKEQMAQADSLLNAGETAKAEELYRKVNMDLPFTTEGTQALLELAKISTETEKYKQAVKYYRDFLLLSKDKEKRYNTFFMIGFIYDEYLDKPKHAAINYRWILKNAPTCELADDAEFMYLHLDEPMIGVEELQAEAKRQGRKVEENAPVAETQADTATTQGQM